GDRHVLHRADAAHGDLLVEVELAVAELADLGQALAQDVKAVGLGLQLGPARGQGVDLALGLPAGGLDRARLAVGPGRRAHDLGPADARAEDHAGGDHQPAGGHRVPQRRGAEPVHAARRGALDALTRLVANAV